MGIKWNADRRPPGYLQLPFLQSANFDEAAEAYWHDRSVVNNGLNSVGMGVHTDVRRKELMTSLVAWQRNLEKSAATLEREAIPLLTSLGYDSSRIRSALESPKTAQPGRAPEYGIARLQMENQLAVPGDGER